METKIFVMAAGKSSRYGSTKCMEKVEGVTVLDRILKVLERVDLEVVVIVNNENADEIFEGTCTKSVFAASGRGTALDIKEYMSHYGEYNAIAIWSDIVITDEDAFVFNVGKLSGNDFEFPITIANYPYVSVIIDAYSRPVDFWYSSKGQNMRKGWTDQCVFKVKSKVFNLIAKDDTELSVLDLLKRAYDAGYNVNTDLNDKFVKSFNTKKELDEIIDSMPSS